MSSPISIPRRNASPSFMAVSPSSPSGLYVPVHRRSPSASSPSSSPSASSSPLLIPPSHSEPQPHSRIYTPAALLSHQPTALTPTFKAEIRARIGAACPEVLSNARVRKSAAFRVRREKAIDASAPNQDIPATASRPMPRRMRPVGRGPERRRAALQLADNWRVPRATVTAPVAVL